jgi:Fur family peroxide stress response transcriptional regulator
MAEESNNKFRDLLSGFEKACRARGLRLTHQRLEIFKRLAERPSHPTAEDIYRKVRRNLRTISLDTVYRTLSTFEDHGLIRRIQAVDNVARFDTNLHPHHHLICIKCKKIEDFYWPDFDELAYPESATEWGKIDSGHVELWGYCRKCRRKLKKVK